MVSVEHVEHAEHVRVATAPLLPPRAQRRRRRRCCCQRQRRRRRRRAELSREVHVVDLAAPRCLVGGVARCRLRLGRRRQRRLSGRKWQRGHQFYAYPHAAESANTRLARAHSCGAVFPILPIHTRATLRPCVVEVGVLFVTTLTPAQRGPYTVGTNEWVVVLSAGPQVTWLGDEWTGRQSDVACSVLPRRYGCSGPLGSTRLRPQTQYHCQSRQWCQ